MTTLKGFRYIGFVTVLCGVIGLALYPIVIKPMINPNEYKKLRSLHSWENYKKT